MDDLRPVRGDMELGGEKTRGHRCSIQWTRWRLVGRPAPATRDSVAMVFQAFHRYAGVAIGEHLGYLFTSAWMILLCLALIETGLVSPVLGWLGILPAVGLLVGVLEETGFKPAGIINAISYVLWSVWLVALGVALLLR